MNSLKFCLLLPQDVVCGVQYVKLEPFVDGTRHSVRVPLEPQVKREYHFLCGTSGCGGKKIPVMCLAYWLSLSASSFVQGSVTLEVMFHNTMLEPGVRWTRGLQRQKVRQWRERERKK